VNVSVDLAKIVAQKDEVVLSFRGGQQKQVDKRPTFVSIAAAPVCGRTNSRLAMDLLESEKIFIDTGGRRNSCDTRLDTVSYLTNESSCCSRLSRTIC